MQFPIQELGSLSKIFRKKCIRYVFTISKIYIVGYYISDLYPWLEASNKSEMKHMWLRILMPVNLLSIYKSTKFVKCLLLSNVNTRPLNWLANLFCVRYSASCTFCSSAVFHWSFCTLEIKCYWSRITNGPDFLILWSSKCQKGSYNRQV